MRIATGKVISGKVVIEGEPLEEGATVTVLAPDGQEPFEIAEEQEAALLEAIDEAERGATVAGVDLLRELGGRS